MPCMSPFHRVHLVTDLFDRLSSSQSTHGTRGYMNSCGSLHGRGVHVNSFGNVHVNSRGAMEQFACCWSSRENKGVEYEYSGWGQVFCCGWVRSSTAGASKVA